LPADGAEKFAIARKGGGIRSFKQTIAFGENPQKHA
jgi:hypothetical protein